jgi:iron complex transport system substrate-binding protein
MFGKRRSVVKIATTVCMVLLLLTVLPAMIMTGCAQNKGETVEKTVSFKITDGMGNELTFEKPAEKIIVFTPSALEIIDGLGGMDKVIGVDSWSVDHKEPLAKGLEGFGDFQSLNMEKITSANPDLIIGLVGWSEQDIKKVQDLGIKVYIVNAGNIEGVYSEILNMGKLIGKDKEAAKLKVDLEKKVNDIVSRTSGLSQDKKPRVFYEVWNDPLMSAGTDTSINDLIDKAGGINILAKDGMTGWPEYNLEKLIQNDPEVIIAPVSLAPEASTIIGDKRLSTISAVKNKRVYIVPDNPVSRPSQNIIKGLIMFATAIHPEIFGNFEVLQ